MSVNKFLVFTILFCSSQTVRMIVFHQFILQVAILYNWLTFQPVGLHQSQDFIPSTCNYLLVYIYSNFCSSDVNYEWYNCIHSAMCGNPHLFACLRMLLVCWISWDASLTFITVHKTWQKWGYSFLECACHAKEWRKYYPMWFKEET